MDSMTPARRIMTLKDADDSARTFRMLFLGSTVTSMAVVIAGVAKAATHRSGLCLPTFGGHDGRSKARCRMKGKCLVALIMTFGACPAALGEDRVAPIALADFDRLLTE